MIFLRSHLCHVGGRWPRGCWRHGEDVEGTPYKHHPAKEHQHGEPITIEHILEAWRKAQPAQAARTVVQHADEN